MFCSSFVALPYELAHTLYQK